MAEETRIHERVLAWVRAFSREHGYPPSTREITTSLGISSTRVTHSILVDLRAEGRMDWVEGRARTLRVVDVDAKHAGTDRAR